MTMKCRFCATPLTDTVADLGLSPMANSYVPANLAGAKEAFYPLHAFVCSKCYLVQLDEFESPQAIFGDYLYFSSFSDSWLKHCEAYCTQMRERFRERE